MVHYYELTPDLDSTTCPFLFPRNVFILFQSPIQDTTFAIESTFLFMVACHSTVWIYPNLINLVVDN